LTVAKPLKSQWEFGELFPPEAVRKVLTVSEVTGSIRRILEKEVGRVSVQGEITNLRAQSSGHIYFTIKDAAAQLACVLFRNEARAINRAWLQDGQKVVADGEITVYEARGQYQLRVDAIEPQGLGALQAAFERLKQKLQAEGLFDPARKRPLPRFPRAVGLATSPDGAAIRDVLHAIARRDPSLQLILAPCRVQGAGAAQEIAAAIQLLNDASRAGAVPPLDLILITRGGGSLEDLWAFNEEIVARAIHASHLPVLCAVGHEIDFTIADFAADFRAATPTAGAEIITEGIFSIAPQIAEAPRLLRALFLRAVAEKKDAALEAARRLARLHPKRVLAEKAQRLDDLQSTLARSLRQQTLRQRDAAQQLAARLRRIRPQAALDRRRGELESSRAALQSRVREQIQRRAERLRQATTRLELLSPASVLNRGYSITIAAASGRVLRDSGAVQPGDRLISRLASGQIESVAEKPSRKG